MLPLGPQRHENDFGNGVRVLHVERWLGRMTADLSLRALLPRAPWRQEETRIGGRMVAQPRLTQWWGDKPYAYSGITHPARPWPEWLEHLRGSVSIEARYELTGALGNMYRDGNDCVGWHADDEPDIVPDSPVASVTFGAPRRFCMRKIAAPKHKVEFTLAHGDMLVMGRGCQRLWQHCVPRQASVTEPRISLTFRAMV